MNVGFIIAEYNPLHNGHVYHIGKTRENGADAVAVIMSGNFVQRGECAVAEKHLRARAALENGADLVLELPMKYALSSAGGFARGGVDTALATGLDGFLSFGCTASGEQLGRLAELKGEISADAVNEEMKLSGCTYPVALSRLISRGAADARTEQLLADANNVLAIEYISALNATGNRLGYKGVARGGAMHDSPAPAGAFASSSFIRDAMKNETDISPFVPADVSALLGDKAVLTDKKKYDAAVYSLLLGKTAADFAQTDNVTAGLENRIAAAVRECSDPEAAAFAVKSKRYTLARIRRVLLCAALGLTRDDTAAGVSYIRVLGADAAGRTLLREMKERALLPVISNLSELPGDNKKALRDAELDYFAGKLFNICRAVPQSGNTEYNIPPAFTE